jgi:hypothetical protein
MREMEGALLEEVGYCFREYYELLYHRESLLQEQRLALIVKKFEARLLELFKSENPFCHYEMLKFPHDAQSEKLWSEYKLLNGQMFYYVKTGLTH